MPEQTVHILPQTTRTTLCLSLHSVVTADDFSQFFEAPLLEIIKENGFYNLFVSYAKDFEGWSEEAADLSFKCISQCSPKAKKAAYVNPLDKRFLLMKTLQPIMTAEIRYFNLGEDQQALEWILSE